METLDAIAILNMTKKLLEKENKTDQMTDDLIEALGMASSALMTISFQALLKDMTE